MAIFSWVFIGYILGILAWALVFSRREPLGLIGLTSLGVLGAILGGLWSHRFYAPVMGSLIWIGAYSIIVALVQSRPERFSTSKRLKELISDTRGDQDKGDRHKAA
jgi:uncharacterized membrane protein YeaQ/YmgE (transglycosylase-associated protein family)